jgi:hypothetical protein
MSNTNEKSWTVSNHYRCARVVGFWPSESKRSDKICNVWWNKKPKLRIDESCFYKFRVLQSDLFSIFLYILNTIQNSISKKNITKKNSLKEFVDSLNKTSWNHLTNWSEIKIFWFNTINFLNLEKYIIFGFQRSKPNRGVTSYLKLGGQGVMRCTAAVRRHLLFCQKLSGQLPILPTRHLRPVGPTTISYLSLG